MQDPKGQVSTYEYDGLGRLSKINYGVGAAGAFSTTFTLDKNGNITAMTDKNGSSSWAYDENNQRTAEVRTQNGATKTVSYSYYANGLLDTMTSYAGATKFTYDDVFRVKTQTNPQQGGQAITYGYDGRNRLTAITFPGGVSRQQTYDTGGRIQVMYLKSGATQLQKFDYFYGSDSRVDKVMEADGSQVVYTYDDLNRLASAVRTGTVPYNQAFGYDANDNRVSVVNNGGTPVVATYDAANQLTRYDTTNYTYDPNGNLTTVDYASTPDDTMSYDAMNTWVGGSVGGQAVGMSYDGMGRRTSRTVAGARADFWYDQTGLTQETGAQAATYLRSVQGSLLSQQSASDTYLYGKDRLGSVTALVGSNGTLANTYSYSPYGYLTRQTGSVATLWTFSIANAAMSPCAFGMVLLK